MSSFTKKFFYGLIPVLAALAVWGCSNPSSPSPEVWNITIQAEHGEITADPAQAEQGKPITLTVIPDEGYALKAGSLKVNDGTVELRGSGETYTFVMPNADVTVDAEFEALPSGHHPVNIPAFDHGGITVSPATAAAGATVALTVSAAEGYALKDGSLAVTDANGISMALTGAGTAYTFVMPDTEVTVAAEFEVVAEGIYTVSVATVQGGSISANPAKAEAGTVIILTVKPAEGYRLKAGSVTVNGGSIADSGNSHTFFMPQSHVTVSAEFELIPDGRHNVTVPSFVNGSVTAEPARAEAGATVALTVSPDGGYALKAGTLAVSGAGGAAELSGSGTAYTFVMPDTDVTVAAEFEELEEGTYSVSIQAQNGTINANPASAKAGTKITLTVTPSAGYALKAGSVKVNDGAVTLEGSGATYTFAMPAANVTATAEFEAISYTITVGQLTNGSVVPDKTSATAGTVISLTVTPDDGYALKAGTLAVTDASDAAVTVSAGSGTAHTFTMPMGNVTVSAEFEALPADSYTVGIDPAISHGTVEADHASAEEGTVVTLTVRPEEGYSLKAGTLKVNGTITPTPSNAAYTFAMPAANVTVTAEFEQTRYNIIIASAITNGVVTADKGTATMGETVALTVTPGEGYRLQAGTLRVNGSITPSGSGPGYTFVMPAAHTTVTAVFEAIQYSININGMNGGAVAATVDNSPVMTAIIGQTVTLTATPNEGHQYLAGSLTVTKADGNAAQTSGSNPYTFTMPASNVTVTAGFNAISYTIAINGGITNGTVAATVDSSPATTATMGQTVTLTATPEGGYEYVAGSLAVTKDSDSGAVQLSGTGPYTFTMPASNVTVTAEFAVPASYTADLQFPVQLNGDFGVTLTDYQGEGAAQTWTLTAGEEPTVYFAVTKGAGQTITLGGTDLASVEQVMTAGATPEGFTIPTLTNTLAVYAVDVADLIFDGDFDGGTPQRVFTLLVTESGSGLDDISYTVTLRPTLDATTLDGNNQPAASTVTIYQRKDGKWLKIRNPTISAANVTYADAGGLSDILYDGAPVNNLMTAFAWVTYNAESGSGADLTPGTTAGHSEYRIFLKASQELGVVSVVYPSGTAYVSLELYGAGPAGAAAAERKITRSAAWTIGGAGATQRRLNDSGSFTNMWIAVRNTSSANNFNTLIFGKNVTLDGQSEAFYATDRSVPWGAMGASMMINVRSNCAMILREHAKITGFNGTKNTYTGALILVQGTSSRCAYFYMQGGAITGNHFGNRLGIAVEDKSGALSSFVYESGVVSNNTANRVVDSNMTVVMTFP
jgi:hypothetical protein